MGYYIQTKQPLNKATQLCYSFNATVVDRPQNLAEVPADKALICVVQNGPFDAAALVHDERELAEFSEDDDPRPKDWLVMHKELAHELAGFKE